MNRQPLRSRVALAYGLIGLLLSLISAVATTMIAERYELILIGSMVDGQARTWQQRLREDPTLQLPVTEQFAAYREADAPVQLRDLPEGVHDLALGARGGLHAAVYGEPGHRLVVLIDVGEIEQLEDYLLQVMIAIVGVGTLLSTWLGWLLANRAIWPVLQLAAAVGALPARPGATTLAAGFGHDEIGRLASAIDGYQQRLLDVDTAERGFFANASHELRTPIAVIQGAVEVMKDDPDVASGQAARLGRIDRALLELGSLLEALLLAARGRPDGSEDVDLGAAVAAAMARIVATDPGAAPRLALRISVALTVRAPRRWVDCIVTVLLQRLLNKAPGTHWIAELSAVGLQLRQPDADDSPGERIQRSDLGINLSFVERLCRGLDWQLEQAIDGDGRLSVHLRTSPRP